MNSMMFRSLLIVMGLAVFGCAGETPDDSVPVDEDEEISAPEPEPEPPACDNNGIAAECEPLDASGCPGTSKCYVIKNIGSACVCPGTIETGGACNTTSECAPTNVCAGTEAPGVCRKTCDPDADDCPEGMYCLFIRGLKQFGYCTPEE